MQRIKMQPVESPDDAFPKSDTATRSVAPTARNPLLAFLHEDMKMMIRLTLPSHVLLTVMMMVVAVGNDGGGGHETFKAERMLSMQKI